MVTVFMPLALSEYTKSSSSVDVRAHSVKTAIEQLEDRFPGFKYRVCDEKGKVRPYVNIFVNSLNVQGKLNTKLKDGDVIHIIRSIPGGT